MGRLKVTLLQGWTDSSKENLGGPATFSRGGNDAVGALQVSLQAEYVSGPEPNPSDNDLIRFARRLGEQHDFGELVETLGGSCEVGLFGSAIFHSDEWPHSQVWYMSDGRDFVLVTFICAASPTSDELAEAREIVSKITLTTRQTGRRA
jgi:hypothetical protein